MKNLASQVLEGNTQAIARVISLVENDSEDVSGIMKTLHQHTGKAQVIGITGVMGSGKSSLILELARAYRKQGKKVGIIAIDPTSPFSGGALLGDRIRMMELCTDDGVFIRSMGTRGMLGGLTSSVFDVVEVLDAAGMDIILVETVGVGQDEVDVIKVADTVLVILVPGLGDSIQAIKAGLMEIADVFVVNKSDKPGAEQTVAEIESLLDLIGDEKEKPSIVKTSAKKQNGITELVHKIEDHALLLQKTKGFETRRRKRYEAELVEIIRRRLMSFIFDEATVKLRIDELVNQISQKRLDVYSAADELLGKILK